MMVNRFTILFVSLLFSFLFVGMVYAHDIPSTSASPGNVLANDRGVFLNQGLFSSFAPDSLVVQTSVGPGSNQSSSIVMYQSSAQESNPAGSSRSSSLSWREAVLVLSGGRNYDSIQKKWGNRKPITGERRENFLRTYRNIALVSS